MNIKLPIMMLLVFSLATGRASAQPINWDSVRADYVKKYQPQQLPAWLFPIIFEEGTGQRDTLYLGYDPDALDWGIGSADTVYGENWEIIDTSRFNALWEDMYNDSLFKVAVRKSITLGTAISFYKGYLPLKIYWDRTSFYSDSLPFADSISPKGMGYFYCGDGDPAYNNCSMFYPYYMTDDPMGKYSFWDSCSFPPPTTLPYIGPAPCYATDSIVLYGTLPIGGGTEIKIVPYGSHIVGISPFANPKKVLPNIYPNPGIDHFNIEWNHHSEIEYFLFEITGKLRLTGTATGPYFTLSTATMPAGIYILTLKCSTEIFMLKVMQL